MVSATPGKLLVVRESTQTLTLIGVQDIATQNFWTASATVSGTLLDEFGNEIFTIALQYVGNSQGNFTADFGDLNFLPPIGRSYTFVIKGQNGSNGKSFSCPVLAEVVQAPKYSGSGQVPSPASGGGGGGGGVPVVPSTPDKYISVGGVNCDARLIASGSRKLTGYTGYVPAQVPHQCYVHYYDLNRVPVVGTDVPLITVGLETGVSTPSAPNVEVQFQNGIAMGITQGPLDTDTTPVAAGDVIQTTYFQ